MALINKHLAVDWGSYSFTTKRGKYCRRWGRLRHNRRPKSVYAQLGPLEVTVGYR